MVSVSVLTLTVIAVERYYAICHPLHFKTTTHRVRTIIIVVWIISLVIIMPEFIVLKTFRRFPDDLPTDLLTTCKPAWKYHHQVRYLYHTGYLLRNTWPLLSRVLCFQKQYTSNILPQM